VGSIAWLAPLKVTLISNESPAVVESEKDEIPSANMVPSPSELLTMPVDSTSFVLYLFRHAKTPTNNRDPLMSEPPASGTDLSNLGFRGHVASAFANPHVAFCFL
jgi:hypothetical protein